MPRQTDERRLRVQLLSSLAGAVAALALALAAAHFYAAPEFNGSAPGIAWFERDFSLALASNLLAVGAGVQAGRGIVRSRLLRATLSRASLLLLLTLVLGAAWASSVALLTLLIAPSHAFAVLRLAALARAWFVERRWQK